MHTSSLCVCHGFIHFVLVVEGYTPATIGYNVLVMHLPQRRLERDI